MNSTRIQKARLFCMVAHAAVAQKRKYTGEPYHIHPFEVADRVALVPGATEDMVIAALLHDVVEDTRRFLDENGNVVKEPSKHLRAGGKLTLEEGITLDLIEQEFGSNVRRLVAGLTDVAMPWDGNRDKRMGMNRDHTAEQAGDVQTVKLADVDNNIRNIAVNDPDFAPKYLSEKRDLLNVLKDGDPELYDSVKTFIREFYAARRA